MKRLSLLLAVLLVMLPGAAVAKDKKFVLMASTIGPIDAGIVGALEDNFEKEKGIRVRHVGAGTGAALNIARKCHIDLVMVHAKSLEEKFVADGYGTERIPLMYNDFVIVGPAHDPAGISGLKDAREALSKLAAAQVKFISRGDKSGTHVAELELWKAAGIKPAGAWYVVYEKGAEGNVATLRFTDRQEAYTVIDRATFLALQKDIKLVVLVEGDEALLNRITLIPVNPGKCSQANLKETMIFVKWLTDPKKGQQVIKSFGVEKYGKPMFFPDSIPWRKAQSGN
ncbi:MAG TPA: substrate-binding domain-containing protein [Syntrophales bacterium]|jgi:tungstate transport system substrate-binding protein|nr:substrate-binding domain-containing protein [Syntrophales bacterium]HON22933.1 substrate-binding domain-containing protein [Syntrophales bacterium]HOU77505.1 substrate-binding domain-containing protein [Syntrophales bacterium]HPC31929.1 substrate-binding domain-containing protein [Syntrophales bacterium]HQG34903.1 substrate-binding domain-containing protein [Syntrophales bacterium]